MRSRFVVHIPGWIQDLMERLVSILKCGTKRNVFRMERSITGLIPPDGSKNLAIEKDPEPSLLLLSRSKTELPPTEESASLCLMYETKRWESLTVEMTSETEDEVPPE
jgi:hypothetical protein